MGTSAGSKVFVEHGWRPAAALALGWEVWWLFILFMRGPNAGRYTWIGWEGGWKARKEKEEGSEIKPSEGDLESGSGSADVDSGFWSGEFRSGFARGNNDEDSPSNGWLRDRWEVTELITRVVKCLSLS